MVKAGKGAALGSQPGRIERAGTTTTVDIVLDGEAARVYGTVYKLEDGEQTAVPGVYVLFKHGEPRQILGATTTDADGGYVFDGVPVGQFEVSAALNTRDRDAKQGVAVAGTLRLEGPPDRDPEAGRAGHGERPGLHARRPDTGRGRGGERRRPRGRLGGRPLHDRGRGGGSGPRRP